MSVLFGARRHRRMSRRQRLQVGCRVFRSGLLRGSSAVSSTQSLFPGARRIADTLGGATCHVSISRLFFFLLVLDPDGSGMSDGRGQSSPCLGLGPAPKSPPATFGRLGLTACGSNAGAMDGDPRRLPVSGHEITRRSFGSRRARLPRSHQGRLGWSEMGKVDGKDKRKSRRAGQGWWVSQMQGPSAFLEDFLPLSPFSLLLFCPLFPCPVGCPLRSVDVVPTEPSSKDQRPASTRPRWDAATATAQTQSISFGLGLVTHRRPPALSRCI